MKKIFLTTTLTFLCSQTFAMFCPNGFNSMNVGDTVDKVTSSCGMPDSIETTKTAPDQPQQWDYFLQPNSSNPTSLKMTVAFNAQKKVVNISVSGTSVMTTPMCGSGNAFKLGDKAEDVKKACGEPSFISKSNSAGAGPEIETTTFIYNTTPVTHLIFQQGKLKERD